MSLKKKIIECLIDNEELHYSFVKEHFRRHIEPFGFVAQHEKTAT